MKRPTRIALFALLSAIAVVVVVVICSSREQAREAPPERRDATGLDAAPPRPGFAPGLRRASGAHREDEGGGGELPPALAVLRASRARRAEVRPVVERFLAAYSAYELGHLGDWGRAELRRTATEGFADELLADPVRIPLGDSEPAAAEIVKVEIYLAPAASEGTATAIRVRAGQRHRTTYLLRRGDREWRIAGVQ